jgi:hypothetical protein
MQQARARLDCTPSAPLPSLDAHHISLNNKRDTKGFLWTLASLGVCVFGIR